MTPLNGFIVVRRENPYRSRTIHNPAYRGMCRIPTWPSDDPREDALLDKYVFELRNDAGFLDDEGVARQLASDLEKASGRGFEVLACSEIVAPEATSLVLRHVIGYDVAGRDPAFWSIVLDFPLTHASEPFLRQLNAEGLFSSAVAAEDFLRLCRKFNLANSERTVFAVFRIHLVV